MFTQDQEYLKSEIDCFLDSQKQEHLAKDIHLFYEKFM